MPLRARLSFRARLPLGRFLLPVLPLALLAGCAEGPEATGRYLMTAPAPVAGLPNRLGSAELREVELPAYASGQEIGWQTPDGAVRSNPLNVWADTPGRAATQLLARQIAQASGATVIPDPWPLAVAPARRIELRVEEMLARADGRFWLKGSYYVSPVTAAGGDVVRFFDLTVPVTAKGRPALPPRNRQPSSNSRSGSPSSSKADRYRLATLVRAGRMPGKP